MAKGIKFNWKCAHCGKRDIAVFKFQFDVPKSYSGVWECPKCSKETRIWFNFTTEAIYSKPTTTEGK